MKPGYLIAVSATALILAGTSTSAVAQATADRGSLAASLQAEINTDNSDNSDNSTRTRTSAATGNLAANNGSTATDSRDQSTTTDDSDHSSASAGRVAANNASTAEDNRNQSRTTSASNSGEGSVSNGGNASYVDSSSTFDAETSAAPGSAATSNQFGANAIVASSTLANYVTGISVNYDAPGSAFGGASVANNLSTGDGASQNFAGLQALNLNTGIGAAQNASVNVAVHTGDINLGQ